MINYLKILKIYYSYQLYWWHIIKIIKVYLIEKIYFKEIRKVKDLKINSLI